MSTKMTRGELIRFLVRYGYNEADAKNLPTAMLKDMVKYIIQNQEGLCI